MANVYSVLSMSSVATVLMAKAPKHSSGRPRLRYIHHHAHSSPKPMPLGIGREFAISSSVGRLR